MLSPDDDRDARSTLARLSNERFCDECNAPPPLVDLETARDRISTKIQVNRSGRVRKKRFYKRAR